MFSDSDIMSHLFPVDTLPSPPVTFVCLFFDSLHLAFITPFSLVPVSSGPPLDLTSFLISCFLPAILAPPFQLLLFFHRAHHLPCYLLPFILPPISPSFLLLPEWPIYHPSSFFPLTLSRLSSLMTLLSLRLPLSPVL